MVNFLTGQGCKEQTQPSWLPARIAVAFGKHFQPGVFAFGIPGLGLVDVSLFLILLAQIMCQKIDLLGFRSSDLKHLVRNLISPEAEALIT